MTRRLTTAFAVAVLCAAGYLVGAGVPALAANTWTVDPSGTDPGSCPGTPPATPFKTVGEAITCSASGDTVLIHSGTYILSSGDLSVSKNLIFTGAGSGSTIIDGNGNGTSPFNIVSGVTASISGLSIRHGADSGITNAGSLTISQSVIGAANSSLTNVGNNGGGHRQHRGIFGQPRPSDPQ